MKKPETLKRFLEEYRKRKFPNFLKYLFLYPKRKYLSYKGKDLISKNPSLIKKIKNQKILILGSGPSSKELKKIPEDIKIMSCNYSPRVLAEQKIKRKIDIHLFSEGNIKREGASYAKIFAKNKIEFLVTDNPAFFLSRRNKNMKKEKVVKDYNFNNYYLKKLIKPSKLKDLQGNSLNHTSSGMRLLQYALYFGAKEIYLAGIDGCFGDYVWGSENKDRENHQEIDNKFIKIISQKYKNIYSVSKNSPITKYIPYKRLELNVKRKR